MIWFIAAAVLLILVLVVNWLRPLPRMAMIVVGGAFVAAGFLRLAYVEWDYVSTTAKPLDVALPLDHAAMMRPPPFVITRTGAYDLWLQTDRLSGLLPGGCLDPDYYGEKLCPGHRRTLDLGWTVLRGGVRIASGTTMPAVDASSSAPKPAHIAPHGVAPQPDVSAASDQTPEYRYLGAFQANGGDRLALAIDLRAPNLRLAARHPRLIVGLSDAETAPAGYNATLFCVLCVFGGGFILLKTLVPQKVTRMIIGLGSDLIDIRRIENSIERFGERFLGRIFTPLEREKSDKRAQRAASYAKRFAAKEACSKALGTGLRRGVFWRDMGVVNLPGGKPSMRLTGGALKRLEELTPKGMTAQIDLTITDDFPLAQAIVVISAVPAA